MMPQKHYTKAPITEALIDLRVTMPPETNLSMLRELHRDIEKAYPTTEEMFAVQGQLEFGSTITTTTRQTPVGYRFLSGDQQQILQARLDGFTFSRLAPYETWNALRDEAFRLWQVYKSATKLNTISRVAVRYVNRLDLPCKPGQVLDFKDYLCTVPEVAPKLPQGLSGYFMQLQIPLDELPSMLVLNQALVPPETLEVVSVLLDIDIFCTVNFSGTSDECWNLLEKLRIQKNNVFNACITDKTREIIQ